MPNANDVFVEFYDTGSYDSWEAAKESGGIYGAISFMADSVDTCGSRMILEDCIEVAMAAAECLDGDARKTLMVRVRYEDGRCFKPFSWEQM